MTRRDLAGLILICIGSAITVGLVLLGALNLFIKLISGGFLAMRNLWLAATGRAPEPWWMSALGVISIFVIGYMLLLTGYVLGGPHG